MQIIKSLLKLLVFICPFFAAAQSTYLPQGDKGYHFVDRLEIKAGTNTDINFSTLKPFSRRFIVRQAEYLDSIRSATDSAGIANGGHPRLTTTDEYNLNSFLMNNTEWVSGSKESFTSRKPILKTFYKDRANMIQVNAKDFFLAVNPMLNLQAGKSNGNDELMFVNSRGISARGMIAKKIGFYTSITDNQERGPTFFQQRVNNFKA